MPIIKHEKIQDLKRIKFLIDAKINDEIEMYCKWAAIPDIGIFFKQAAEFVLKKDKDWKLYKNKERR